MSDADFRTAYDALLEQMPDPPSFERIRTQTLRPQPRLVPGWQVVMVAAVAVLLGFGGVALFTGGQSGTGEGVDGVEARLVEAIADMGGLCNESSTMADFDGDGLTDAVAVGFTDCETPADPSDPAMVVSWSSGETESWDLVQCGVAQPEGPPRPTGICEVFAAPDLNDDGRAELAMKVQQAAGSIVLLQFYALTPEEATQTPIQVTPGGPGPGDGSGDESTGSDQSGRHHPDSGAVFLSGCAEFDSNCLNRDNVLLSGNYVQIFAVLLPT